MNNSNGFERHLEVNGERYFVRDSGAGDTAVLLLHGWPDDGTVWRHQIKFLTDAGYRVICPDWIGHGRSSIPVDVSRYNRYRLAEDTVGLLDALNLDKVHLVAHDYGATVSWETARLYGTRFHSFVALSVGHAYRIVKEILGGRALRYYWLVLHGLNWSRRYYLQNEAKTFRKKFTGHPDAEYILDKLCGDGNKTFFTLWEQANPALPVALEFFFHNRKDFAKVTIPTLGIYSENDVWMTKGQLEKSGEYVTGEWKFVELKKCDHWLQLERPDEVNNVLLQWLQAH